MPTPAQNCMYADFFFFSKIVRIHQERLRLCVCVCVLEGHSFPARRNIARRGVALRGEIQSAEPPQDHLAWPAAARSRGGRLLHAAFLHLRGLLRRLEQYRIIGDGTVCPLLPPRPPDLDQSCRVPFFAAPAERRLLAKETRVRRLLVVPPVLFEPFVGQCRSGRGGKCWSSRPVLRSRIAALCEGSGGNAGRQRRPRGAAAPLPGHYVCLSRTECRRGARETGGAM